MYKIYIDTTKKEKKSVKLVETKGAQGKESEKEIDTVSGSIDVASTINNLLKKHKLHPANIQEIVPNTGPGSFTGIKTGLAIANVFNWALGKKKLTELYKPNYGGEPNITPKNPV